MRIHPPTAHNTPGPPLVIHIGRSALPFMPPVCWTGGMNPSSPHNVPATTQPSEQLLNSIAQRMRDNSLRSRQIGDLGEQYAAVWLENQGWRTLDRNWHCRYGELDVISRNPMGQIVFVEVKTRRTLRYGTPQEAVTASKQINLRHAAVQWLSEPSHRMPHNGVRFDVITVVIQGDRPLLHHIEGAF